jgi:peptidoglycan/LPS O-acetylase OafA/YrhL
MDKSVSEPASHLTLSSSKYRPDIDGLRAIAVAAVIANHLWSGPLPGGFLGVDMFFVISGYVITTSLSQHHGSARELFLGFYCRRGKRILPALLVCVMVTCLAGALFINPESSEYSGSMKAGIFAIFGLSNIYFFAQSSNYFEPSAAWNLFTHTWSLGVEEQFYLVFPLLLWMTGYTSRRPNGWSSLWATQVVLTLLSLALYVWLNLRSISGAYFIMLPRAWELCTGSMMALACLSGPRLQEAAFELVPWLSLFIIAAALFIPASLQLYGTVAIVAGTAALIMTLRPGHWLYRALTVRTLVRLGLISYSLYLWHWSVLVIARWTVGVDWATAPFLLAATMGLATASYVLIERPLRRAKWSSSDAVSIGYGLSAAALTAGSIVVVQTALSRALYTGTPAPLAAKGMTTLIDDKWQAGVLEWRPRDCVMTSNDDVGKTIDVDRCTLRGTQKPASTRRFLVIGNSFSTAEFEMYSVLAEDGLGSVTATSSWGGPAVRELLKESSPWFKAHAYYWDSVIPALFAHLERGDFVIMINDLFELTPVTPSPADLALLRTGLQRIAGDLQRKGVQIIFQSQNPFMREAGCTPDMAKRQWFNAVNAVSLCKYYSKSQSIERIRPLSDVLEEIGNTNPNFHVLDLFPVLCPGDVCRLYNEQGVFLYRDQVSHPSIEANYLARPLILSAVNGAIASLQRNKTP